MTNRRATTLSSRVGIFLLLWGFASSLALADTQLLNQGAWVVDGAADTAPNPQDIRVSVEGRFAGVFSELKFFYKLQNSETPQIFSVKGSGAMRPVLLPPGAFGATFYATGYWDCERGLIQNLRITEVDLRLNPNAPGLLQLTGKASNFSSFEATDFSLQFFPPTQQSVKVEVSHRLVATRNFCVDQGKQSQHEGFRLARMASSYLSRETHDSDQSAYVDIRDTAVRVDLRNENGFILSAPFPMGRPKLFLSHSDAQPRNTPTLSIKFSEPSPNEITPQGFVTKSSNQSDDNVDLWGNWERAKQQYVVGEMIGRFAYTLEAIPPGLCSSVSVSAASYSRALLAPDSIAAAFGANLATGTQSVATIPLPTSLVGTTLRVRDSVGAERLAPLSLFHRCRLTTKSLQEQRVE